MWAAIIKYGLTILMVLIFNNFSLAPIKADLKNPEILEYSYSLNSDFKSFTVDQINANDSDSVVSIEIPESFLGLPVRRVNKCAFKNLTNLREVKLSDNITVIDDYAFASCSSLEVINAPSYLEKIGDYAFYGCSSLKNFDIPNTVTSIGEGAFSKCNNLESVTIPDKVYEIKGYTFYECKSLQNVFLPDGVKIIGTFAFANMDSLISVTFPQTLEKIDYLAFVGTNQLFEIYNLSSLNITKSVLFTVKPAYIHTSLDEKSCLFSKNNFIFSYDNEKNYLCGYIGNSSELVLPDYGTDYYIHDNAFYNADYLTSLVIPNCVLAIGKGAFYGADNLKDITFGNKVAVIDNDAFSNCYSIRELKFNQGLLVIGTKAFSNCDELLSVTIPSSMTSILDNAFAGCGKLIEIYNFSALDITKGSQDSFVIGANALDIYTTQKETKISTIGDFVFYDNSDQHYLISYNGDSETLIFPAFDYTYEIYNNAFTHCNKIKTLYIPKCITKIGSNAFSSLITIREVYYQGNKDEWNALLKNSLYSISSFQVLCKYYYDVKENFD